MKKWYAYYGRTSTTDQTLEQQRSAVLEAVPKDAEVEMYEEQLSGWQGDRPQFRLLQEDIIRGRVKAVYTWQISRLGRYAKKTVEFLHLCNERGVPVKVVNSNFDFSGPFGLTVFTMLAELAQMESDLKSANIREKFEQKRRDSKGKWKMHGCPEGVFSEKVIRAAPGIYAMIDSGMSNRQIKMSTHIDERTIARLRSQQGKELLSRKMYAERNPGWHLKVEEG